MVKQSTLKGLVLYTYKLFNSQGHCSQHREYVHVCIFFSLRTFFIEGLCIRSAEIMQHLSSKRAALMCQCPLFNAL